MKLKTNNSTVLVIPDLQIPYHHRDAFKFLEAVADLYGPSDVVCIGDEVDQYMLSAYDHSPNADSAGREYDRTVDCMQELYELFPEVMACTSNHTSRVLKKASRAGIPSQYMKSIKEFMQAPKGWNWNDNWNIADVIYEHGDAVGGLVPHRLAAIANRRSTVIGHHHSSSGIHYVANNDEMIFGMNVGCLVDMNSVAFAYSKIHKTKSTLSCGIVEKGVPHVLPFIINSKGRWVGRVL